MTQIKIAVVVGSLRKDSINRKFAQALVKLAPADFAFNFVSIGSLPLYNQDDEELPNAAVSQFKADIAEAQGVLFVTPEYNRSIPGVLKNALDIGSRPYGKGVWGGKVAGVMGVSPGAMGTALAQSHLRGILSFFDMPTFGQPELYIQMKEGLIDATGQIGQDSRGFLQGWMDKYAALVRQHA